MNTLADVLALRSAELRVALESPMVVRQLLGYSFDYVDVNLELRVKYCPPSSSFVPMVMPAAPNNGPVDMCRPPFAGPFAAGPLTNQDMDEPKF